MRKLPDKISTRRYPASTIGPVTIPTMGIRVAWMLPIHEIAEEDWSRSSTVR